jgi:hypothetical protein
MAGTAMPLLQEQLMEPVRFETMAAEYSRAFSSARTTKNLLVLFILLALLVQIGGFVLVHFVGVLSPTVEPGAPAAPAMNDHAAPSTTNPASQPSAPRVTKASLLKLLGIRPEFEVETTIEVQNPDGTVSRTTESTPLKVSEELKDRFVNATSQADKDRVTREIFAQSSPASTRPATGTDPRGGPEASSAQAKITSAPATAPASTAAKPVAAISLEPARKLFLSLGTSEWNTILCWAMSVSKFVAMVLSLMLVFTLLLTMDLSLLGRLGGVAGFVSAFFWSLLLLAMLIPWHEAVRMGLACGATHNLGELQAEIQNLPAGTKGFSWAMAGFYCRFMVFPIIALAVLLLVQTKFAKGFRQTTVSTTMETAKP